MSERHAWITLGALAGVLVGAAIPAAAAALLAVVPIAAVTLGVSAAWRAGGWPVWWLLATTVLAAWGVTALEAFRWYGTATTGVWEAVAGGGLAAVGPLAWLRWAAATAPMALAVGGALATVLLVRRAAIVDAAAAIRPRWGESTDDEAGEDRHLRSVS